MAPAQKPSPSCRASLYSSQRGPATATDRRASSREQRSHSLDDSSPDADSASPPTEKASPDFSFLEVGCRAGPSGFFEWGLSSNCKPVSSLAANSPAGFEGPEEPRPPGQKAAAASGPHLPHPQEGCQWRRPAGPHLCSGGTSQRLDVQGLHRWDPWEGRCSQESPPPDWGLWERGAHLASVAPKTGLALEGWVAAATAPSQP